MSISLSLSLSKLISVSMAFTSSPPGSTTKSMISFSPERSLMGVINREAVLGDGLAFISRYISSFSACAVDKHGAIKQDDMATTDNDLLNHLVIYYFVFIFVYTIIIA